MGVAQPDADVVVVGGGPAGAAMSAHLARRGWQVVLLEGRDFARPRPADMRSGEVLSPGAQCELAVLGLPLDRADWRLLPFDVLRQTWPNGRVTYDPLPSGLEFWQTDRGRLDRALCALATASGADVREGCRVSDVARDAGGAICGVVTKAGPRGPGRAWHAPLVVDASGRYSAILAQLQLKRAEPACRRAAMVCFFDAISGCDPGVWEQHFLGTHNTVLKGSMMRDGLYRFSCETDLAFRDDVVARQGRATPYDTVLAVLKETSPRLYRRFSAAHPLPYHTAYAPIGVRVASIVQDGLVLVGDAAGYLDPSTGQGMEFALRMARLAARTIDRALAAHDYRRELFAPYVQGRRREIDTATRRLRLYLRLSGHRPALRLASYVAPARAALISALVTPRPSAPVW